MLRRRATVGTGGYTGDVFYTRNFNCCVKQLDGLEWRGTVNVMSVVNANNFTLSMVVQDVRRKFQVHAESSSIYAFGWCLVSFTTSQGMKLVLD